MAIDILDELHRRDLADGVLYGHLIGFDYWLRFLDGAEHEGQWHAANALSHERCCELIEMLTQEQLDACYWRGMIPPPNSDERAEITWSRSATIHPNPHGGYVILDPLWQQTIYGLKSGPRIRLRPGELELLKAAGLPATWEGVLNVLWHRIGVCRLKYLYCKGAV
ncbi:MAG TPA: hypothetical protein VFS21_40325 [Roseiflexaceae bacterium]|nr:hypothetical protein [Roseiflexaceae bacterium]